DLFAVVDKKHRLYSKKATTNRPVHLPLSANYPLAPQRIDPVRRVGHGREAPELDAQMEADRITISRYPPAGVLVNSDMEVLQFRGATSSFLAPAPGKASFNVLKMAREGLMLPLRSAINKARKDNRRVRKEQVHVNQNGSAIVASIEVIPLKNLKDRCYL